MRIALLTLATPLDDRPAVGIYNVRQAAALSRAGHATEIFTVALMLPRWCVRLGGAFERQIRRPGRQTRDGVAINVVRARVAFPRFVRERLAPRLPRVVSHGFRLLTERVLLRRLRAFRPDALVVHGVMPWGEIALAIGDRFGIPVIAVEHSKEDIDRLSAHAGLRRHVAGVAARMRGVLAVSDAMVRTLRDCGVSRAGLLLNGVEIPEALGERRRDRFTVLCAGAYHERKGHAVLIEAFARAALPGGVLRLVGEPTDEIRRQIAYWDIGDRVEVVPSMSQAQLMCEMSSADLFALPSWSEAFGLVYVEAMAAGTPVVMTSDCGAAEHVTHGREGWIVPPRDAAALAGVLRRARRVGRCEREEMGRSGRRLAASRFTWSSNAARVVDTLRKRPARACSDAGARHRRLETA